MRELNPRRGFESVLKRQKSMLCVEPPHLHFLNVYNYIAPGFSGDNYVKAFDCWAQMGSFPYEWMASFDKLDNEVLPPREDFRSSLKATDLTEEHYGVCQWAWMDHQMESMADFLILYNNL